MDQLAARGTTVLIPPDADKRKGARPGGTVAATRSCAGCSKRARPRPLGKRKAMIEPVFANTKFNRRIDRFLRRGRAACRSEWRLITATHNLLKLHTATAGRPEGAPRERT